MNTTEQESITKTIYRVATPTMIQMFLESSYHLIDAIWIGMLGSIALAAVASSSFILWMIFSATALVETGVNSLTARYFGAKDEKSFNSISFNGMRFGIIYSFIISLIMIIFSDSLFNLMGLEEEVKESAKLFLIPFLAGLPISMMQLTCLAIFRGIGDTKTPLYILSGSLLLNTILAPLLIFGIIFPEMGISGGSFATLICHILGLLTCIYLLKKKNIIKQPSPLNLSSILEITKIGSPIAVNGIIFCLVYIFLTNVISNFGTEAVAALGIGHRVESMAYCIAVGFSIAATTLVGQNIGAKNYKKADSFAWKITSFCGGVIFIISMLILIFKESIAGIFTNDPLVLANASGYLTAIGYTEVFLGIEIVLEGIFSGLGNTLPPTIIGLPINILRVPLAYYLSQHFGVDGIWWAIGLTTALKGFILLIWYKITSKKLNLKEA